MIHSYPAVVVQLDIGTWTSCILDVRLSTHIQ